MKYGSWRCLCYDNENERNQRPHGYLGFWLRETKRREFRNEAIGGGNYMACQNESVNITHYYHGFPSTKASKEPED